MPLRHLPAALRAAFGVVALYGLLLQAFLAAATPAVSLVHVPGILCADTSGTGSPGGEHPVAHDHACCTAAPSACLIEPPDGAAILGSAPPRAVRIVVRPEAALPKTGPPTWSHSARGPPPV